MTNPWKPLDPLELPPDDAMGMLSTTVMPGERRALALNVRGTSSGHTSIGIRISLAGLRSDALQIYQVNWTGNDLGDWVAAELEWLGDASAEQQVSLLPGVTRQIWIQVQPEVAASAGRFFGSVSLSAADGVAKEVPIQIKILNTPFPRPSMHFGGWDYSVGFDNYAVGEANRAQFVAYLRERYVDTPWAQSVVMNWKSLDADGNITYPLDTSALARWLSAWPDARRFRVYLEVGDKIGTIPTADERFAAVVAGWATAWAAEIRRLNKSPEQFDLLLVDEPQTAEQFRTTERWARAIRQSGAGFRIWTDLAQQDPVQLPENLLEVVDTVAINLRYAEHRPTAHETWSQSLSQKGKAIEVYAFDGPARRLDPYAYYRLTPWRAFFMGATAVSFWSFADTGGSPSDNEFAANDYNYSPLYIGRELVRPGKHMEAAAEGIQDTQYLRMLKNVAATHPSEGVRLRANELLDQASTFIHESASSSKSQWRFQQEASEADRQRIEIGEFLDSIG